MLSLHATRSHQRFHPISRQKLLVVADLKFITSLSNGWRWGSTWTFLYTLLSREVSRFLTPSWRWATNPPFLHDRGWLTLNGCPQAQVDGKSCSGKLYCNRRESLNSCLFNAKHWPLRGMAMSQELAPFSLACCVRLNSSGLRDASFCFLFFSWIYTSPAGVFLNKRPFWKWFLNNFKLAPFFFPVPIAQNAIVFRDMYLQFSNYLRAALQFACLE